MSRDSQDDAPRIVGTRTVYEGWARYLVAEVRMPDGTRIGREVEDHGPAVAVLPYDPERRVALLVRQFRTPPCFVDGTASILEAPAGLREEDDPEACARREAFEEVGLRLSTFEPAGRVWSLPGLSTERMDLFLAPYRAADREEGAGGGLAEEHENIEVVEVPLATLAAEAEAGEIADMKTLCLIQTLRLRHPGLFATTDRD
ncbi:NUDIX domain-containing protein [Methylobacterium indicum]|uniref:GDP-mannose pyrophosphatase n=1 Tax=Methylobacterium indicum TaxID=1775910 RepID=A0A0J6QY14_9HYPH|nr:NUDIX hydrolase [Methylobacterium indicum]KMO14037.1 NUDIX hydrolase [Methylobacterium indicum]KMO18511.1 NUDIX hydrolase [Methylobacterium indicum]BCM85136.1 ADP-ribose pyrophosphatase [Methylobacterium indicum]